MSVPRVLLLSGGIGAGHLTAARAVEGELQRRGVFVAHFDAFDLISRPARWTYANVHTGLLEFAPELYGPLYERGSTSRLLQQLHERLAARSRRKLALVLSAVKPDVVFVTHSLGCALAAPLRAQFGYRLVVLTTDYRAHAFQIHPAVDAYCASHAWAASDLEAAGIPPERISVTGLPLRPEFDSVPARAEARRALGLPVEDSLILVTRGGMAAGRETVALLQGLLVSPALESARVVAILGNRPRGYRLAARSLPPAPRLRVERFVERMDLFLAAADVVVGKAGGLSSTETFAVGRPLVIYAPNEGIETANVRRFLSAGAALDAGRSPARAVSAVAALLGNADRRAAVVAAGQAIITPRSREAVARTLEQLAGVSARASI